MGIFSRFSKKEEVSKVVQFDLKGEVHKLFETVIKLEEVENIYKHLTSIADKMTDVIVTNYTSTFNESIPEQYENYLNIPKRINTTADYCLNNAVTREQFLEAVKMVGRVPSSIIYDNTSYFNSLQINLQNIVKLKDKLEQSNIFN